MADAPSLALDLQRFLVASYAYYVLNETVMPDAEYDAISRRLLEGYDTFEHRHKHLVPKDALTAGTLFDLPETGYPRIVAGAAESLIVSGRGPTQGRLDL